MAGTTDETRVGRRRFIEGALATSVTLPGVASADARDPSVTIDFTDCVTAEITGDVEEITGLHLRVWNVVDVVDDHLTVEDVGAITPGDTLVNGLRIRRYDPDAGVLALALNTLAYNHLSAANVYLDGAPDFFGNGADVGQANRIAGGAAFTDLTVGDGTYADGDVVTAEATVTSVSDRSRDVFVGFIAIGPDGIAYTNGGTTGKAGTTGRTGRTGRTGMTGKKVTLASGETRTVTLDWTVESGVPDGTYDIQVAIWRESDPADLQVRYDERYVHGAFAVEGRSSVTGTSGR